MNARRWFARGLDALAILVVLVALFRFFVFPRLQSQGPVAAPPVVLAPLTGTVPYRLAQHKGRVVFLDFGASWCEPCQQSLPLVERFARAHPEVDVVFVDVGEPLPIARDFVTKMHVGLGTIDPADETARAFGVSNYPTMIVVDASGRWQKTLPGFNPAIESIMADDAKRFGPVGSVRSAAGRKGAT